MALTIQTRFVDAVSSKLPWLPRHLVLPLTAAVVLIPTLTALAFSYGPMVSVQPESGTLSGGASSVADASASGGQSVRFRAAGGFQANCIVKPSDCGYPDATNTGVPAG